jgi:hypothetical protein
MTVQELIDELNKVQNKEIEVIIRGTDPTDWIYNNEIDSCEVEKVYFDDEGVGDNFWESRDNDDDDDDDDGGRECFVIDGGMF